MKKLGVFVLASTLLASAAVCAAPSGPQGFNGGSDGFSDGFAYSSAPRGFDNEVNTVAAIKKNGTDDQFVTLTGRLVNYLGHDRYEFADNTGTIEVELDDDQNWSNISKGELIQVQGKIDRDFLSTTVELYRARPVSQVGPAPAPAM